MSRIISFAVLIAIIIVIGLLFYKVLIGFFIPVFLASVLVVVFRPLHRWVLEHSGYRDRVAAVITTLLIMLMLFLPIAVVGTAAATQGLRLIKENDASTLELRLQRIRDSLGLQLPPYNDEIRLAETEIQDIVQESSGSILTEEDPHIVKLGARCKKTLLELQAAVDAAEPDHPWGPQFESLVQLTSMVGKPAEDEEYVIVQPAVQLKSGFGRLKTDLYGGGLVALLREKANPTSAEISMMTDSVVGYAQPRLLTITGATGSFLVKLVFGSVILIVATFFFLYDGPAMVKTIMRLSPLDDAYEQELLLEFDRISRAVVLATILSAVAQGITAGLGYFVVGMDFLTLLVMLTTVFAMVPFVGPAVVWIPVCLYVGVYEERYLAAILLAVWGVAVVGTVDNLVKAVVLHGQSQLHPLLALLSVLGGVQALGPIGIVVGPMVVAMLQTLLGILQRELMHFDELADAGLMARKGKPSRRQARQQSRADAEGTQEQAGEAAVEQKHGASGGETTAPSAETPADRPSDASKESE